MIKNSIFKMIKNEKLDDVNILLKSYKK